MNLETEQIRLKLIETQISLLDHQKALLQYQHREVTAAITQLNTAEPEPVPA
jgi:prefoldin subunit 5